MALAYRFKEFEAEKAKGRQLSGVKINQIDNDDTLAHQYTKVDEEVNKGKTLEIIAQKAGAKSFMPITLGVISTEVMARL